jgi:hypothetical protein
MLECALPKRRRRPVAARPGQQSPPVTHPAPKEAQRVGGAAFAPVRRGRVFAFHLTSFWAACLPVVIAGQAVPLSPPLSSEVRPGAWRVPAPVPLAAGPPWRQHRLLAAAISFADQPSPSLGTFLSFLKFRRRPARFLNASQSALPTARHDGLPSPQNRASATNLLRRRNLFLALPATSQSRYPRIGVSPLVSAAPASRARSPSWLN